MSQILNYENDYRERLSGSRKQYHGANITFALETVPDPVATANANGIPKFKEIEVITVQYPGGEVTPVQVNDSHRAEYAEQYKAFKSNQEQPIEGTPLSHWALMPRPVVEEFKYLGVKSVEQLAEANDEAKRKMGPLQAWCKKAKEWMKAAKSTQAEVVALQEQLERQSARADRLENTVTQLIQRIEASEGIRFNEPTNGRN